MPAVTMVSSPVIPVAMAEAPVVPLPDHEDATTRHLVRVAGWSVMLLGFVIGFLLLWDQPVQPVRVALNFVAGCIGGTALLLARWRRWTLATYLLVWGVWVSVSLVAARNGGVNGPNLLNYPVIIVLAGWLLGARATLTLVGLTALLFLGFIWADVQGLLKPVQVANRVAGAVYLAGILVLTAAATLLSRRNYMSRVREAQQTAANLAASEASLRKLLRAVEQSPEAIVITDLREDIEYVNEAFVRRTGYARDEVVGRASADYSSNGLAPAQREGLRTTLARGDSWAGEQVNYRKDGQELIESVVVAPIRQTDGRVSHYVELKQDITERKRAADEIHRLAHFDGLTSLPNRSTLMERLHVLRGRAGRPPSTQHALLLLDLDRFTTFNDARGSEMGDRLLCAVALRLSEILPPQDLLVRVAGDEFAVVLHGLGVDASLAGRHALAFAEKLQAALLRPLRLEGDAQDAQLGASVGITLYPQTSDDGAHDALRRAGTALHRAKQAGGGRAAFLSRAWVRPPSSAFGWSANCAMPLAQASCGCTCSRRWMCRARSRVPRCWCAGSIRVTAWWRRACSFRWPRSPTSSSAWASGCWPMPVRCWRSRCSASGGCGSRSTSARGSSGRRVLWGNCGQCWLPRGPTPGC